jgi:hypothetical protein
MRVCSFFIRICLCICCSAALSVLIITSPYIYTEYRHLYIVGAVAGVGDSTGLWRTQHFRQYVPCVLCAMRLYFPSTGSMSVILYSRSKFNINQDRVSA